MFAHAHGRSIEVRSHPSLRRNRLELSSDNLYQISRTLRRIPNRHLDQLNRIEIRQRPRAGGSTNQVGGSNDRIPRSDRRYFVVLDIDCFASPWNTSSNGLNYTLLHEMGHVVDWATGSFVWIRQNDPEGYRAIVARSHSGVTTGNQEKFADAYADLFYYRGQARSETRSCQAVWDSPCFEGLRERYMMSNAAIA